MTTETRDGYNPSPYETEERLRLARSVAKEGIWDWNLSTETVYFDPRYYLMAGYPVDEFPHRREEFQQRVHPDDLAEVMAIVQNFLKGQSSRCEAQFRFRKKAGDYLWIHSKWLIAEWDEQGKPVRLVGTHADITERKQTEEMLRRQNEMLARAEQIAHLGSWEWEIETDQVRWSEELFRIFQRDPARGAPSQAEHPQLYVPEDMVRLREVVDACMSRGTPYELELRAIRADGTLRHCIARGQAAYDSTGRIVRLVGSFQDVTEGKRAEAALRESQEGYRSMLQSVQVGVVVHAPDTRILFSNPRASQLLGLTPDQMRDKTAIDPAWRFVREDETPMPVEEYPVNQVLATHQPLTNLTLGILRPDREGLTWVQCNAHQDWDIDGNLLRVVVTFADITERKRSEEALRETHHRLEKVLEIETVGIMFWDFSSGRLVDANDTFLKTLGYSRHELQSGELTWQRFTPPEYHERSLAQLERFRELGRIGPYEKEYVHKDGTRQWFIFAGSSLGGDECVEFCVDISDRKRAEQQLRATEQQLRIERDFVEKLFDVTEDTIFVFEPDTGKPVRWNNACRKITGYSDQEIASLKFPDTYYSQEELALADEAIQKGYSDGTGTVELTLLTKDGKAIPFEYSGSLVPTQEGEPRRFISIGRDLTERKRAEQARQQREALFRAVVENTYDGIVLFKKDRRIMYVSPSHKRVSGYSPEDTLGSDAISYLHPDDQAYAAEVLSNISRHPGQGMSLEYRLRHKLGHWVWIEATVTNLLDDPYVNAFVVNSHDITERKQAELERETALGQLKKTLEGSIKAIARTIEIRDPYTAGHQERVAQLAQAIAVELGLDEIRIEGLGFGGLIHDIGKISVPADLLSTPRRLRSLEIELLRGHAQAGYDIIKDIDFPWPVGDMILQHHERLDGSGYPQGLKDPEILYEAKILAVADVVEAMSSHRPYRPGFGIDVALEHIRESRSTLYDAKAVDACLTLFRDKGFAFKAAI